MIRKVLDKKYANLVNKSTCYKIRKFLNIKKYIILEKIIEAKKNLIRRL